MHDIDNFQQLFKFTYLPTHDNYIQNVENNVNFRSIKKRANFERQYHRIKRFQGEKQMMNRKQK